MSETPGNAETPGDAETPDTTVAGPDSVGMPDAPDTPATPQALGTPQASATPEAQESAAQPETGEVSAASPADEPESALAVGASGGDEDSASPADATTPVVARADARVRRQRRRRRWATVGRVAGRVLASLAVLALLPASVWAVLNIPDISVSLAEPTVVVQPAAVDSGFVCAGSLREQTDASGASAGASLGSVSLTVAGNAVAADLSGTDLGQSTASDDVAGFSLDAVTDSLVLTSPANQTLAAGVTAAQVSTESAAGTVATACAAPSSDSWLVGGETTTGKTTLLRLVNATSSTAAVTVTPVTSEGFGTDTVVSVPGQSEVSVPLSALAPDATALAVHLSSTGAPVSAFLQETSVDGLTASGADVWGAGDSLATQTVIPGISVSSGAMTVDVVTDADAQVRVTAQSATGGSGATTEVQATGDSVTQVELSGLSDDLYVVTITSSANLVAAAQVESQTDGETDYAWLSSAPLSEATTSFAVPSLGEDATATVTMYASESGTVTFTGPDGSQTQVSVTEGTATTFAVDPGAYELSTDAPVAASVAISGSGAAGYPITQQTSAIEAVTVHR